MHKPTALICLLLATLTLIAFANNIKAMATTTMPMIRTSAVDREVFGIKLFSEQRMMS